MKLELVSKQMNKYKNGNCEHNKIILNESGEIK